MPKAKSALKNVTLSEVSFVGDGDNPEAHITLLKMKEGPVSEIRAVAKDYDGDRESLLKIWAAKRPQIITKSVAVTFFEILQDQQVRDLIWDMVWALEDSIYSIMNDSSVTGKGELIAQTVEEFNEAITTITKGEVAMPEELKKQLKKYKDQVEKLQADLDAANSSLEEANGTIETMKARGNDGACGTCGHVEEAPETTIDKSNLPAEVVKQLDAQEAQLKKQQESIEKMQDDTLTTTMIAKAAELPNIGDTTEVAKTLKKAHKVDAELGEVVFNLLKDANARIAEGGLLDENNDGNGDGGESAIDKLNAAATELRKSNGDLTHEQAFKQVLNSNDELRAQYIEEVNS